MTPDDTYPDARILAALRSGRRLCPDCLGWRYRHRLGWQARHGDDPREVWPCTTCKGEGLEKAPEVTRYPEIS